MRGAASVLGVDILGEVDLGLLAPLAGVFFGDTFAFLADFGVAVAFGEIFPETAGVFFGVAAFGVGTTALGTVGFGVAFFCTDFFGETAGRGVVFTAAG